MSRGASPRSPPPSSLADEMPILDRSPRPASSLPSSLCGARVAHDSPASVKRALEGTRRSWEAVRTALGSRDAPPPPCLFASARSSPRCSTASCDASREEGDANSAHGHSGWFSEGFHSSRALANLLSARLDSVESDVAEAKRHLASLERWRRRVDASAEIASESGDSEDAAFASRAEDSSARTRSYLVCKKSFVELVARSVFGSARERAERESSFSRRARRRADRGEASRKRKRKRTRFLSVGLRPREPRDATQSARGAFAAPVAAGVAGRGAFERRIRFRTTRFRTTRWNARRGVRRVRRRVRRRVHRPARPVRRSWFGTLEAHRGRARGES